MTKGIGGTVGTGVKKGYVVRFYTAVTCLTNRMVEADSVDDAISMVLRYTVDMYDDALSYVDVCLASDLYNGIHSDVVARIPYPVHYASTYMVSINGRVYNTRCTE